MKKSIKLLAVLLAVFMMLGLVSCRKGEKVPKENVPEVTTIAPTEPVEEEPAEVEEPVEEEPEEPAEEPEEEPAEEPEADVETEDEAEEQAEEADVDDADDTEEAEEPADEADDTEEAEEPADEADDADDAEEPADEADDAEEAEEPADEVDDTEEAEEPADEADDADDAEDAVEEVAEEAEEQVEDLEEKDADEVLDPAELFMHKQGYRVYDISGIDQVAVDNAIFSANFDPQALMMGLQYLQESGVLDMLNENLDASSPEALQESGVNLFEKLPIAQGLAYLDRFNINLYSIAFFDFKDAEEAKDAFYTGQGIIELSDEEKETLMNAYAQMKNELVELAKEDPDKATEVMDVFEALIGQVSLESPVWLKQDEGDLLRTWQIDLPVGTFFIEEVQQDSRIYLVMSLVSTDGDTEVKKINEGLGFFEVSPSFAIGDAK